MSALNTQIPTNLSIEQVIANHISVEAATEMSGVCLIILTNVVYS
jgi:hypothetical protein